jgi:hypothetical protein
LSKVKVVSSTSLELESLVGFNIIGACISSHGREREASDEFTSLAGESIVSWRTRDLVLIVWGEEVMSWTGLLAKDE